MNPFSARPKSDFKNPVPQMIAEVTGLHNKYKFKLKYNKTIWFVLVDLENISNIPKIYYIKNINSIYDIKFIVPRVRPSRPC